MDIGRPDQTSESASTRTPPEILQMIFEQSMPSSASLEKSLITEQREEYEMKRTIVEVCKLWRAVGLELLYAEVVIRSVDSLPALLRTISAPGSGIGELIRKVVIWCVVPFGDDRAAFQYCVQRIVARCPALSHLDLHPSFHLISVDTRPCEVQLRSLPLYLFHGPFNITHIDWGYCLLISDLVSLLHQCPNLESLCFHLRSYDFPGQLDAEYILKSKVVLPNLRKLYLVRSDGNMRPASAVDTYVDSELAAQWSMPRLEHFTYRNAISSGFANIVEFCRIHGGSLRYLHLAPDWRHWILNDTVQKIIDACPALEHLVLWMSADFDVVPKLSHPKIMWMDLWVELAPLKRVELLLQSRVPGLPLLRGMRVFDSRLFRQDAPDLPALLPPQTADERNGFEYTFYGVNVKQIGNLVFQMDQTACLMLEDSADSSEDEDAFDPDTIPPYDDTSDPWGSSSDDDTSSSDGEDSVREDLLCQCEEWEPNPEALAAFSANMPEPAFKVSRYG